MKITAWVVWLAVLALTLTGCASGPAGGFQSGYPPLHMAVLTGDLPKVKTLLGQGVAVDARDANGDTALAMAVISYKPEIIEFLLSKGANINSANRSGASPLVYTTLVGRKPEQARFLLDRGADVNLVGSTTTKMTPLIYAAIYGNADVVRLLLARGADPSVRDIGGNTALEHAKNNKHTETYNVLLAAGSLPAKPVVAVAPVQADADLDALVASKDIKGLKAYLDKKPVALALIKDDQLRLLLTGPAELRITDIVELAKAKKKDTLIIAQINSGGGPYKKFSLAEMEALQKQGISDEVIAAMITVTTEYNKVQKLSPGPQSIQPAPAAPVVQAYSQAPPQPVAAPQQEAQDPKSNECIQLALAIKACDRGSGFIPFVGGLAAEGCKSTARSKFNCSLPLEAIMR